MKKNFFLTLMLAVFSIATSWAQSPDDGVYTIAGDANLTRGYMCAGQNYANYPVLTEITYSGYTGNSVAAITNGKNWYVTTKAEGTYIYNLGLDKYLVKDNGNINFGDTPYAWTIKDNGSFKAIYDAALGKYLSMGCGRGPADRPIAWDTNASDGGAKHTFTAVENGATTFATQIAKVEADLAALIDTDPYVLLKTSSGTYLSTTSVANDTHLSIQAEGTKFVLETSQDGNAYYIKVLGSSPAQYVSKYSGNAWGSSTSETPYAWSFSDPDENGYVTISRVGASTYCLGTTLTPSAGIAVYSNAGSESGTPNKWFIEEHNAGAVEYTFQITNPTGESVSATYKGNAVSAGKIIEIEGLVDKSLFDATDVEGYTWSVVVNSGAKTITIVYVEKYNGSYYLKTSSGTYLNFTPHASLSTAVTFQTRGSELYIEPSGDNYYITQLNSTPVKYLTVSSNNAWDVAASTAAFAWSISTPDANGYVTITKASDSNHRLGNDGNQNASTGVFANVGANCNKWQLVKVGPLDYTFAINNPTSEIVSATYNGNAIAAGGTISIDGRVDTSLFSANEIEGYSWNVELYPDTRTITLVYEKKYNWSIVDLPDGATITYNSAAVTDGGIVGVDYDSQYLAVTCPNGYTWAVTRDDENKIVAITFIQLTSQENPQAVVDLLNRIGGEGTAAKFRIVLDPSLNYTADQFSINGENGKVLIKGTTISAITTGIGWYLQNYAKINIAWNSLNEKTVSGAAYADLSDIPVPTAEEVHTSAAKYRYYLNYCTFGYSMTSWTWKRWQQEIDWMALHGINMPLQIVGLEEVWRKFLTMEEGGKYGYTNAEAKAFVAGPAFTAWWGMNNLEGWGGTAADGWGGVQDDAWYTRQQQLAKQICDRQRELGMEPVLPGFSGMVPTNFTTKTSVPTDENGGKWCGFQRPRIIDPTYAGFADIAADYYKCLKEVMGESKYYSMDPFHEGGSISSGKYTEAYYAVYAAMEAAKPASQWVIQQWQWDNNQKKSLDAVPAGRLIVLDLFSDGKPRFETYKGYAPQDAVFCAIPNFGGRSGLMGRLNNVAENYFKFKSQYPNNVKGIGAAPEAIEQTPIAYDLIFQLPWMGAKPDVEEWVKNYSIARYGVENEEMQEAWNLLRQGPLNYGTDEFQGPIEDVWAAIPNLNANPASAWGKTINSAASIYTTERRQMLVDATYKLLAQSSSIEKNSIYESNYNYDIVEFGGGVLADYAYDLLLGIRDAKTNGGVNDEKYIARRNAFLALIADVDEFKGTNLNFRLGKWTQEARDAAAEAVALGATTANADWYEYNNARTILTTWGDQAQSVGGSQAMLRDYSYRSWQGLLKDVYLPRWQHYFANNCSTSSNYFFFSWNWAHGMVNSPSDNAKSSTKLAQNAVGYSYSRDPEGNTVEKAAEVLGKYIIPVKIGENTYYAYRHLTNTLSADYTIVRTEGSTINFSEFFLTNLEGAVLTGGFIDGEAGDLTAVRVISGVDGSNKYSATITFTDNTVLNFTVVVNSTEMAAEKEALAALIEDMKELTAQVGSYNKIGSLTDLTLNTTSGNQYYIWTNAQSSAEGPIANLIDNQVGTHFHTDYSSGNVTSGSHYIAVDLGDGNVLGNFTFDYTTRNGGGSDFPDKIVVYASNDRDSNYELLAVITEPEFPQATGRKWEFGDVLYTNKRYLRFNVYAERGYWHMSEFNLYKAKATADVSDVYNDTELTDDFAAARYNILLDAINVYNNATTEAEVIAAKAALQAAYEELLALADVQPDEPDGYPALTKLIADFDALMEELANVSYSSTAAENVTLQIENANEAGYLYSNAEIKEAGDKGLGALLDDDGNTYIHTQWGGNSEDGLNHYLRVYLGEEPSLSDFSFSYLTRDNYNAEKPKQITVSGCATIDGEYETIAVLTDLPSASAQTYESPVYSVNGYKYLRFMVDDTYRDLTDDNGHKAYSMAKFALYNVTEKTIKTVTATNYATMAAITNDEVAAAYNALQTAKGVEQSGSYTEKENEYSSLKAVYDALIATTSKVFNGVYNINYKGAPVFIGYTEAFGGLTGASAGYRLVNPNKDNTGEGHLANQENAIKAKVAADALFTIVPNSEATGYTLSAQGLYMQTTSLTSQWCVQSFDADKAKAGVYLFEDTGENIYKLKSNKANTQYVNDWGPVFGNDMSNKDNLSTFTLTKVTEYTLAVPAAGMTTLCLPFNVQLPAGVKAYDVVTFTEESGRYKYNLAAVAVAGDVLAKNTPVIIEAEPGDYVFTITMRDMGAKVANTGSVLLSGLVKTTVAAGNNYIFDGKNFNIVAEATVVAANQCWMAIASKGSTIYKDFADAPEVPVEYPVAGKVYRIKNYTVNTPVDYRYHYLVNSNVSIAFPTWVDADDKSAMWVCTSADADTHKYTFANALGTAALGWKGVAEAEDALEFTISGGTIAGTVTLADGTTSLALTTEAWNNSGNVAFNQASDLKIQHIDHWSTDWYLEVVDNPGVSFTKSISKDNQWATMYLPYAVEIPQGVEVYYANEIEGKTINLTQLNGTIPAKTAVLLRRAEVAAVDGDAPATPTTVEYTFNLTTTDDTVEANLFEGKIMQTAIDATGARVYLLVNYNAKEKFYWMAAEYDANCQLSNEGGYVKCDANKCYLKLPEQQASSSYSFRYEGTTGVEEVKGENGKVKAVYDLQGRKLTEVTKPGFYIVDGEKVWIK